jgi:voltage-gated sodium channel
VQDERFVPPTLLKSSFQQQQDASDMATAAGNQTSLFANPDDMKKKVWDALKKEPYNVANFYHKTGVWRRLATHSLFENVTLAVISLNALWIAIDTDNNTAATLLQAEPIFQIVDHAFCWYFAFEWYVRFSAFKRKRDGLKDRWFVFDSCLVFMMVAETWVMTIVLLGIGSSGGSGMGGASILRLFRLLRLSRLARMLRSMPELMILIKGMVAASRSVFFTMCLLVIGLYLFAIAMRQLTQGTDVGELFFYSVPASMYKLTIEGVFLDNLGYTVDTIAESSPFYAVIFLIFVVFAALMVMNMLIGVLCEVVSAVASTEREEMNMLPSNRSSSR